MNYIMIVKNEDERIRYKDLILNNSHKIITIDEAISLNYTLTQLQKDRLHWPPNTAYLFLMDHA